jgi:hypothetical protein
MDCTPREGLHRENLFLNHLKLLDWSSGMGSIPKRVRPEIELSGPDDAVPVLLGSRLNAPNTGIMFYGLKLDYWFAELSTPPIL